jgi:hypothetical protein
MSNCVKMFAIDSIRRFGCFSPSFFSCYEPCIFHPSFCIFTPISLNSSLDAYQNPFHLQGRSVSRSFAENFNRIFP